MYSESHAGYVVMIHWCRKRLTIFIDAHVSIWAVKLGDIEEEVCPISIKMHGGPLSISRVIGRTIVLVQNFSVRTIICSCGGLQKLEGVKWEFYRSPF